MNSNIKLLFAKQSSSALKIALLLLLSILFWAQFFLTAIQVSARQAIERERKLKLRLKLAFTHTFVSLFTCLVMFDCYCCCCRCWLEEKWESSPFACHSRVVSALLFSSRLISVTCERIVAQVEKVKTLNISLFQRQQTSCQVNL